MAEATELLCVALLVLGVTVEGDYILQVNVMRYQNPTHGGISLSPGTCCDGNCNEMCTNQLTFCLRPSGGTSTSNFCPLGEFSTPGAGGDNDVYVIGDLLGLLNPLPFMGRLWPGSVQLYVIVRTDGEDLIERIFIDVDPIPGDGYSPATFYSGESGFGTIQLRFMVACTENYFGSDCGTFCKERDDAQGHYTCDSEGNRVCRAGYQNPQTSCTCILGETCLVPSSMVTGNGNTYTTITGSATPSPMNQSVGGSSSTGAVIGGVVAAVVVLTLSVVVVVLLLLWIIHKKVSLTGPREDYKSSNEWPNPGDNPTYSGASEPVEPAQNLATHSYEYISSRPATDTASSNRTYSYAYVGGVTAVRQTPAPVHYESLRTSNQVVDPTGHYEFSNQVVDPTGHYEFSNQVADPTGHYEFSNEQ